VSTEFHSDSHAARTASGGRRARRVCAHPRAGPVRGHRLVKALRSIVAAAGLRTVVAVTRSTGDTRAKLERIHDLIETIEDAVDASSRPKPGKIDESEKSFNAAEREIAEILAGEGKDVKALPESTTRTPDSEVNGVPTEFKTLNDGASNSTVKNALNSAEGQAENVVINGRNSGILQDEAQLGLNRFLGANPDKMASVRIIGDGWGINWP
jgi:hypothetical protein